MNSLADLMASIISHRSSRSQKTLIPHFDLPPLGALASESVRPSEKHTLAGDQGYPSGNNDSLTYPLRFLETCRDSIREAHDGTDYYYSEYHDTTTKESLSLFGSCNHLILDIYLTDDLS